MSTHLACPKPRLPSPRAQWALKELTSKQSRSFKIGGLTGAANGHFGTGVPMTKGVVEWKRMSK